MLRPATPLSVLLFVSFVLLLLSVISTPIVKGIPIAKFQGVNFGVFGYCKGSQCSGIRIGYTTDGLFGDGNNDADFNLPSSTRHSLSSLLIVHPVAAFMNLVCLALALAAHFHGASHSARYLLGLLILLLPTLLVTLLAFLVDILLFVPHLQWGGWIVLASTILITASGVVTCAMRRTLVARKARKRRIAENAEMSGENFYNRQNSLPRASSPPPLGREAKIPMVNGAPGSDALPAFATFDASRKASDEETVPLNQRTPSNRAPGSHVADPQEDGSERYGPPRSRSNPPPPFRGNAPPISTLNGPLRATSNGTVRTPSNGPLRSPSSGPPASRNIGPPARSVSNGPPMSRSNQPARSASSGPPRSTTRGPYDTPRDEFGNPLPPSIALGPPPPQSHQQPMNAIPPNPYSHEAMSPLGPPGPLGQPREGAFDMARGRGRGGYPSRGPMGSRGGYGGPRGPPPPGSGARGGYAGRGRGGYPPRPLPVNTGAGMPPGAGQSQGQRGPPPDYPPQPSGMSPGRYSPPEDGQIPRKQVHTGSPIDQQPPYGGVQYGARNQSSAGGMRGASTTPPIPQVYSQVTSPGQAVPSDSSTSRYGPPERQVTDRGDGLGGMGEQQPPRHAPPPSRDPGPNPTSIYSPQEYVPPHGNWPPGPRSGSRPPGNLPEQRAPMQQAAQPIANAAGNSQLRPEAARFNSGGSEVYYEDSDPRFAARRGPPIPTQAGPAAMPPSLQAGAAPLRPVMPLAQTASYEDLQPGARSPAESDSSHFTSVSQRGVNPNWRPGPGDMGSMVPLRKPVQQRRDMILGNNPDFEIPGTSRPGRGGRGGTMMRGGGGPGPRNPNQIPNSLADGRYPDSQM